MHHINFHPTLSLLSTQIWQNIKAKAIQLTPLQKRVALVACAVFFVIIGFLALIDAIRTYRKRVPREPKGNAFDVPVMQEPVDMLSKVVFIRIHSVCTQLEKRHELLRPCQHGCTIQLSNGREKQGFLHGDEIHDIVKNLDATKVQIKFGNLESGDLLLRHFEDDKYKANEILKKIFNVINAINTPADILVEKVSAFSIDGVCMESLPCQHDCKISLLDGRAMEMRLHGDDLYVLLKAVDHVWNMTAPGHFERYADTKAKNDANKVLIKLFNLNAV